jgi:hypothetical protein
MTLTTFRWKLCRLLFDETLLVAEEAGESVNDLGPSACTVIFPKISPTPFYLMRRDP